MTLNSISTPKLGPTKGDKSVLKRTPQTSAKGVPPEFIRKTFPRTWYHARWRLLTWLPRGVLNETFAYQVIAFIELEESIQEAPFERYTDLSGLTQIRIGIEVHAFKEHAAATCFEVPLKALQCPL